mmetsp:Transcript_29080/g.42709  ORF Transcript_29080/g.42709 Transcript_29080/m.42709 type:complete len:418 (-) Transcript_29080:92-1345(-)|eukprot:CAMPEP_0116034914 /NCGR_PEP_ID=MMETSP0321-20121206/19978_1 /TAXON_ID=163516 /ORGANISM="Leptocylindrus danicus var. danicus, Strain B650" /LENGTH=417 /DNA_ID=CAMNT_0003511491 /DNA_START=73 /DNA_END=1326 /DNA_ORIENTATION=+
MIDGYALGLVLIVLVSIIWALASVLTQHIYCDLDFGNPFLLTFLSSSLFVIYLPYEYAKEWSKNRFFDAADDADSEVSMHGLEISGPENISHQRIQYAAIPTINEGGGVETDDLRPPRNKHASKISKQETFRIALNIAPVWFLANYTYNQSLEWTSVSSSTLLASTGSLFAFFFAVLFKDESFSAARLFGVLFFVLGSLLTGLSDSGNSDDACGDPTNSAAINATTSLLRFRELAVQDEGESSEVDIPNARIWGDAASLLSAVMYGAYTVGLRKLCPKDESRISMELLFGYIGLIMVAVLSPITLILCLLGVVDFQGFSLQVMGWIALKGFFDNVISDYLWARSVILTSATVASVGVGLTIPMAFISDIVMGRWEPTIESVVGGLSVLAGFLIVNLYTSVDKSNQDSDDKEGTGELL